jgi:hypothetical protein
MSLEKISGSGFSQSSSFSGEGKDQIESSKASELSQEKTEKIEDQIKIE